MREQLMLTEHELHEALTIWTNGQYNPTGMLSAASPLAATVHGEVPATARRGAFPLLTRHRGRVRSLPRRVSHAWGAMRPYGDGRGA